MTNDDILINDWTNLLKCTLHDNSASQSLLWEQLKEISVEMNAKWAYDSVKKDQIFSIIKLSFSEYISAISTVDFSSTDSGMYTRLFTVIELIFFKLKQDILVNFTKDVKHIDMLINELERFFYIDSTFPFAKLIERMLLLLVVTNENMVDVYLGFIIDIIDKKFILFGNDKKKYEITIEYILNNVSVSLINEIEKCKKKGVKYILQILLHCETFKYISGQLLPTYEIPETLQDLFNDHIGDINKLFHNLKGTKLTSSTLSILYDYFHSLNLDTEFDDAFLKHRLISIYNDNWNSLLNDIDLSDTYEYNPLIKNISLLDNMENGKTTGKPSNVDNDFITPNFLHSEQNSNLNYNTIFLENLKDEMRTKFKQSILDITRFHKGLSDVINSYYSIIDSFNFDVTQFENFRDTTYALLMLVLNYTPNLSLFIRNYYTPQLLRRIAIYQSDWIVGYKIPNGFDYILINMLPKVLRRILENVAATATKKLQTPQTIPELNCQFSGIFFKKTDFYFDLPKSLPILPNKHYLEFWKKASNKESLNLPNRNLVGSIHFAEMESPFKDKNGNSITIKLPMNMACILLCYNKKEILSIDEITYQLNIKKDQERILLKCLQTLTRNKLLLKNKSKFKLNDAPIESKRLNSDKSLRIT